MLNIFTLAYREATLGDLPSENTSEVPLRVVFARYVERMLTHREHMKRWKPEQVRHTVAQQAASLMRAYHQTLYVEEAER